MNVPSRLLTVDSLSLATVIITARLKRLVPELNSRLATLSIAELLVLGTAALVGRLTLKSVPAWCLFGLATAWTANKRRQNLKDDESESSAENTVFPDVTPHQTVATDERPHAEHPLPPNHRARPSLDQPDTTRQKPQHGIPCSNAEPTPPRSRPLHGLGSRGSSRRRQGPRHGKRLSRRRRR